MIISRIAKRRKSYRTFAERVRLARTWTGLSRKALARQVGVSPSAAAQWEHPTGTMPSVENLSRVAVATRVAFEWLATGRGPAHASATDEPAVSLSEFAHDLAEEYLLRLWRRASPKARELLTGLLEEMERARK